MRLGEQRSVRSIWRNLEVPDRHEFVAQVGGLTLRIWIFCRPLECGWLDQRA